MGEAEDKPVMPQGLLGAVPNMITACVVMSGCGLMMSASAPEYNPLRGVVIFWVGFVADILDGLAARKLNVGSHFGSYFDELADLTAFGIAPAVYFMRHYIEPGDGFSLSLARFNFNFFLSKGCMTAISGYAYMLSSVFRISRELVVHRGERPKFFVGLPTNGGALFLIHAVYFFPTQKWLFVLVLLLSAVMAAPVYIYKDPTGLLVPFAEQRASMKAARLLEEKMLKKGK